jgi:beta-glucosidase-like glycosyl hydrolase
MTQQPHRISLPLMVMACLSLALPTRGAAQAARSPSVERLLAGMTPREKIAQLVIPWIAGSYMAEDDPTFRKIVSWADSLRVGGLIVSVGSPLDIAAKLNTLQRHARVPLLIASDLEAGTALRLTGGTPFPSNMGIGATGRDADAYAVGRITALEGRAVGIHFALAPVADINSNAANPIINTRSFGADPHAVARLVSAEVRGLQDNGMLATAKHFPGHGDVEIDSHLALPLLNVPWTRLDTLELVPFRSAIASRVTAVMSAHIALPELEAGAPAPATLVPAVLTGMLRDSLHFTGVIVTDALNMGGIVSGYGAGEAAVLAFLAGADVLLQPADPAVAIDAMSAALRQGRFSRERLDRSVRRVLQMKQRAGLFRHRTVPLDKVMDIVGSDAFRDTSRAIAARALVLLGDRNGVLDGVRRTRGIRSVIIYGDELNPTAGAALVSELRARGDSIETFRLSPSSGPASYDSARAVIDKAPVTIFAVAVRAFAGRGTIGMPDPLARLAEATSRARPTVFVSLGSPYVGAQVPGLGTYLLAWAANPITEWAVAEALTGAAISGRMPVPVPPSIPLGAGIRLAELPSRR